MRTFLEALPLVNSLTDSSPVSLETVLLVFGGLLMVGALISGLVRRSFLSLAALFVVTGFVLGDGGLEVLDFRARSEFVHDLAVVALVVILFRDGLEVEAEMLQREWHLPFRKLVLGMPITGAIVACAAHWIVGLDWLESALLGALLSPTDPVLSSSVVTNPRVPRLVRHSLNLESGLNDGLALPAVLAFTAALADEEGFVWWQFVLQDITLGFAFGIALAWVAAKVMPRGRKLADSIPAHAQSLYALGVAFAIYGIAVGLPVDGNGFIAVFVGAITLGILRPDLRVNFENRADDIVEIVKLGIFVVFGALLTAGGLFGDGWAAVAFAFVVLVVARPVAIWISLAGTAVDTATKAFMAWFGPKGVATMTFSLFVLGEGVPDGERIFYLAALCVFASVLAHGLSDTPGSEWLARRSDRSSTGDARGPDRGPQGAHVG